MGRINSKFLFLAITLLVTVFVSGCVSSWDTYSNNNSDTQAIPKENEKTPTCIPDWKCSPWSDCISTGIQTRTCIDNNNCGANTGKPIESQTCGFTPASITNATLSVQDIGNSTNHILIGADCTIPPLNSCKNTTQVSVPGAEHYILEPTVQITNTGTSDLNDINIDVSILKDGVVLKKDINVIYSQGRDVIKTISKGDTVIGKLNYNTQLYGGTFPSGRYILKIDLRRGASTKIIATDSKDFDI